MAWHHIIPYQTLRDTWNRLVQQHIQTDWQEARVTIRQFLSLCDRNLPNLDETLDRMRFENTDRKRAGHNREERLTTPEVNDLGTAATWQAWNIVGGPAGYSRSDDPAGDGVDRFRVGLRPSERDRMRFVEELSTSLQTFVGAGPDPGHAALETLSEDVTLARRLTGNNLVGCEAPIPFREEMWVRDNGLWRKRTENE
jgi:hypothetical protein